MYVYAGQITIGADVVSLTLSTVNIESETESTSFLHTIYGVFQPEWAKESCGPNAYNSIMVLYLIFINNFDLRCILQKLVNRIHCGRKT